MTSDIIQKSVEKILSHSIDLTIISVEFNSIGGGSINDSYQIIINKKERFFCKLNSAKKFPSLFIKEKNGLEFLAKQDIIKIPSVIACEEFDDKQILILEWIDHGPGTEKFWENFGEQLSMLHRISDNHFGLDEDNYMGALTQCNNPSKTWTDFFIHQRLEPQIRLALDNRLLDNKSLSHFNNLYKKLPEIFPLESPSLLHGDLWSGNFLCNHNNEPVLIDPAVYFGHRSVDLAMTTLFGGFDKKFYETYNHHFPFPQNHREQWKICNLYPLLIHLNLFGETYRLDILQTIKGF